mgnify:CR=1 FL=1
MAGTALRLVPKAQTATEVVKARLVKGGPEFVMTSAVRAAHRDWDTAVRAYYCQSHNPAGNGEDVSVETTRVVTPEMTKEKWGKLVDLLDRCSARGFDRKALLTAVYATPVYHYYDRVQTRVYHQKPEVKRKRRRADRERYKGMTSQQKREKIHRTTSKRRIPALVALLGKLSRCQPGGRS